MKHLPLFHCISWQLSTVSCQILVSYYLLVTYVVKIYITLILRLYSCQETKIGYPEFLQCPKFSLFIKEPSKLKNE